MDDEKLMEELARVMSASQGLDWDGKAQGTEYANHGYWLPIARATLPIIAREVAAETERCVRVADAAKYTDAEVGIDHELQVWNACAEAIVMAIGGRAINAAMDAE